MSIRADASREGATGNPENLQKLLQKKIFQWQSQMPRHGMGVQSVSYQAGGLPSSGWRPWKWSAPQINGEKHLPLKVQCDSVSSRNKPKDREECKACVVSKSISLLKMKTFFSLKLLPPSSCLYRLNHHYSSLNMNILNFMLL